MAASTQKVLKSIGIKDASLFRQQVYINGKWSDADSGETTDITNPSTGEVLGTVPNCGAAEAKRAIEAANAGLADVALQNRKRACCDNAPLV